VPITVALKEPEGLLGISSKITFISVCSCEGSSVARRIRKRVEVYRMRSAMSTQPHQGAARRTAVAALSLVIATSIIGSPRASAIAQDDLWKRINDAHVAAGCPPFTHSAALGDVALQYAQTMAAHNGQKDFSETPTFSPTTEQLLSGRGYNTTSLGEMEYFNPFGPPESTLPYPPPADWWGDSRARLAAEFWLSSGTRDLITNCGLQQMDDAVWVIDNNWAAAAIMGTPA
jgi:hypothetical protein